VARWVLYRAGGTRQISPWAVVAAGAVAAVQPRAGLPTQRDLRGIINALLYFTRTACPWRLLPREFAPWTTVRYYFDFLYNSGLVFPPLFTRA
jgi:transposase